MLEVVDPVGTALFALSAAWHAAPGAVAKPSNRLTTCERLSVEHESPGWGAIHWTQETTWSAAAHSG